jgi:choline monooxygenase
LLDQLADTVSELESEPLESFEWVHEERLVFDANWKIYTDNFVEGYHIPGIHPQFHAAIEFERFETIALDGLVRMSAPPRDGLFYRGKWLWMWPNWTLSLFNGGMNTSRINPISHNQTEFGDPARTRTPNLLIRSQLLYPVELRDRTRADVASQTRKIKA